MNESSHTSDAGLRDRLQARLEFLYGERAAGCLPRLLERIGRLHAAGTQPADRLWSQRDVVLITYGDQVREPGQPPLHAMGRFLDDVGLAAAINVLHVLPFFPYSSDDGFSVIDYRSIDPRLGSWDDVAALGESFDLMFDLVLNHCSAEHVWFRKFCEGVPPFVDYFHDVDPAVDLSAVTRPRSTPLLTPVQTSRGTRHVWTTFSADQVDLDFSNPDVLIEMFDVLLFYLARRARIIRLDAIAYLWKRIGTPSIHLPETHAVVKLIRDVVDAAAPGTILLTETNVPHRENVGYFGRGDEAHMVYQFSLAPLLLDAFLSGDAEPLNGWLAGLEQPGPGRTYLNFTASHDGIGVRPLEGIVSQQRLERLIRSVQRGGGFVSMKRNADGGESPYELNATYFSALCGDRSLPAARQVRRFLASQSVMLALQGIPAIYFHSLFGTPNDSQGVAQTGRARTINRRKFDRRELQSLLSSPVAPAAQVLAGYRQMILTRIRQPAFHPDAGQTVHDAPDPALVAFTRRARDDAQKILVLCNCSDREIAVDLSRLGDVSPGIDLLSGERFSGRSFHLPADAAAWLSAGD